MKTITETSSRDDLHDNLASLENILHGAWDKLNAIHGASPETRALNALVDGIHTVQQASIDLAKTYGINTEGMATYGIHLND